jgi:hypothetical protein
MQRTRLRRAADLWRLVAEGDVTAYMRRMFRKEIEELTAMLRDDPDWDELRRVLRRRRIRPAEVLMASFCEDGDGNEFGVLVTADRRVIDYRRRIARRRQGPRVLAWRDRTDDPGVITDFPQVAIALEMLDA